MNYRFYHIPKNFLLLVAGLVWFAAGFNIVRLGLLSSEKAWSVVSIACAGGVFLLFFFLIFRRLIHKHTVRITGFAQERVHILRFFDAKSYCIMAFMMTFGILLRQFQWWPGYCIKMFYTGLGASLIGAGIGFLISFSREMRRLAPAIEATK